MLEIIKKLIFFIFLYTTGFSVWSQNSGDIKKTPKNLVYEIKLGYDDTEVDTSEDKILIAAHLYARMKSANNGEKKGEIILDVTKDTIWRRKYTNNKTYLSVRSFTNDSTVNVHKNRNPKGTNLYPFYYTQNKDKEYDIFIIKGKTKKIMNYDCFLVKMKIKHISKDKAVNELIESMGAEIVEMYVTENLILPQFINPLLEINIEDYTFFPLEIKSYQEKLATSYKTITIKEINF